MAEKKWKPASKRAKKMDRFACSKEGLQLIKFTAEFISNLEKDLAVIDRTNCRIAHIDHETKTVTMEEVCLKI